MVGLPGIILCNLSAVLLAPLGAEIEKDLNLSHTLLGVLQSGLFIGNALGSILFSSLVARRGILSAGMAAASMLVLGNLLSAVVFFAPMAAGRVAIGLGLSGMVLFASSVTVHAFPSRQSALLNLIHALLAGVSMVGMVIITPLAAALGGWWRVPLVLAAASAILLLALGTRSVTWTPAPDADSEAAKAPIPWLSPSLFRWALVFTAYIMIETAVILFFPVYAQTHPGVTSAAAARLGAFFIAGIVTGRLLMAWLIKESAPHGLLTFCLVSGGSLCLLLALPVRCAPAAGLLLFMGGLLTGPTPPLAISGAIRHVGRSRNSVLAGMNLLSCFGGFGGAILTGWLSDTLGLQSALLLIALLFLASSVPLLGGKLKRESIIGRSPITPACDGIEPESGPSRT